MSCKNHMFEIIESAIIDNTQEGRPPEVPYEVVCQLFMAAGYSINNLQPVIEALGFPLKNGFVTLGAYAL